MKGLKKMLIDKDKSQKWLAKKLNVSENTVSRWVRGTFYPSRKKQIELCELFDCTMEDLN